MERARKSLAFLDTHVALWLFDRKLGKLSPRARRCMNETPLCVSPIVLLEMQYLHEIKRIAHTPVMVWQWLERHLAVTMIETPFLSVMRAALPIRWTRDAFDRILVAAAEVESAVLITSDKEIRAHYKQAIW